MTLLAISTAQRFQRLRFEEYVICIILYLSFYIFFPDFKQKLMNTLFSPVCYEEAKPCNVKYINTKIYIEEELYRKVDEYRKNRKINQSNYLHKKIHPLFLNNFVGLNDIIRGRLNKMFSNTNHQLINLDNGGYRAGYDGTFSLLK